MNRAQLVTHQQEIFFQIPDKQVQIRGTVFVLPKFSKTSSRLAMVVRVSGGGGLLYLYPPLRDTPDPFDSLPARLQTILLEHGWFGRHQSLYRHRIIPTFKPPPPVPFPRPAPVDKINVIKIKEEKRSSPRRAVFCRLEPHNTNRNSNRRNNGLIRNGLVAQDACRNKKWQ